MARRHRPREDMRRVEHVVARSTSTSQERTMKAKKSSRHAKHDWSNPRSDANTNLLLAITLPLGVILVALYYFMQ